MHEIIEMAIHPPFIPPCKFCDCVKCHKPIFYGEEYCSLWEGALCYDCALDYLRENKHLAGD